MLKRIISLGVLTLLVQLNVSAMMEDYEIGSKQSHRVSRQANLEQDPEGRQAVLNVSMAIFMGKGAEEQDKQARESLEQVLARISPNSQSEFLMTAHRLLTEEMSESHRVKIAESLAKISLDGMEMFVLHVGSFVKGMEDDDRINVISQLSDYYKKPGNTANPAPSFPCSYSFITFVMNVMESPLIKDLREHNRAKAICSLAQLSDQIGKEVISCADRLIKDERIIDEDQRTFIVCSLASIPERYFYSVYNAIECSKNKMEKGEKPKVVRILENLFSRQDEESFSARLQSLKLKGMNNDDKNDAVRALVESFQKT